MSQTYPCLRVVKQGGTHQEVTVKDGTTKEVYVVVKNSPFQVQVGVDYGDSPLQAQQAQMNLNHVQLRAELVYDAPGQKLVDFVKMKPLETKFHVNESGSQASVECRVKVLTSQLEDMLFYIRFFAVDPLSDKELSQRYSVFSGRIKVISKPEQQRKRKAGGNKKRTVHDLLLESLSRVEKSQQQHRQMLQRMSECVQADNLPSSHQAIPNTPSLASILQSTSSGIPSSLNSSSLLSSSSLMATSQSVEQPMKKKKIFDDERPLDFEVAFRDLMDAFDALAPDQRVERMRVFVEHAGTSNEVLSELHDLFSAEGLERQLGSQVALEVEERETAMSYNEQGKLKCECLDCPHKQELERIEDFYKEVFSLG